MKHRSLLKKRILLLLTLLCLAIASLQSGAATDIAVTNTNDSGPGSLRDALRIANNDDTISFDVTGTITLTSHELVVNKSVTIRGPGADMLSINGNATHRVFQIRPPNVCPAIAVSISGLTITNGFDPNGGGAGILNLFSDLTISDCTVSNNVTGDDGGGIYNAHGICGAHLTVNNSTIIGNSARQAGGGAGGGIFNWSSDSQATLNINNSTISGNSAQTGGGIYNLARTRRNVSSSATATISNSTISGNTATTSRGGGIYTEGNSGFFFGIARLTVTNSTISGNSATSLGGGIYATGTTVTIGQTILKTGSSGQNIYRNAGTVTSLGYNLSNDNASGLLIGPGDQINTDPLLGPLQNNGGPTFTHALLPGSPAIDRGNPSFTPPPDKDQRDCPFVRVFNGRIDVGSFESQPQPPRPCDSPRPRPTPPARGSQ